MSYASEVLADAPVHYYRLSEAGTAFEDTGSAGQGLSNYYPDAVHPSQNGPVGAAVLFDPDENGDLHTDVNRGRDSLATYECWVNFPAVPTAATALFTTTPTDGGSGGTHALGVDSSGHLTMFVYAGADLTIASPDVVTAGVWYHVAASVGAEGMRLRVNGVTKASRSDITSATSISDQVRVWLRGGLYAAKGNAGFLIAEPAYWDRQLSTTRTDTHYAAAQTGSGAGPVSRLPALTLTGLGALSVTLSPPVHPVGLPALRLTGVGALSVTLSGPGTSHSASTDTADLSGGRSRSGAGEDHSTHPVPPLPDHLTATPQRIVAQVLPRPTLRNGRPVL